MTRVPILALSAALAATLTTGLTAQKNKTTCGSDVPVTVSIAGTPDATDGNALVSDGGGAYLNSPRGSDKITAIFQVNNCTFDFTMNLNFSRRSMWALLVDPVDGPFTRRGNFFNFDRVGSVPVTTAPDFLSSVYCTTATTSRNPDGSIPGPLAAPLDNYAGCGSDEYGSFVRRGGGISLDGDERLGFRSSPLDLQSPPVCPDAQNPACMTDYIRVYHSPAMPATATDPARPETWVLRPELPAQATYRYWSSGAYLFDSMQSVPFVITVTRQP